MPLVDAPAHILVVDDEAPLLEELYEFLTWNGMAVGTASNGVEALARLSDDPAITLVLTDIRMPQLDGLGLANRILRARGDADAIEVVLMTGHGSVENAAQAVRAGVFDFLCKPMVLSDTLTVLQRAHAKALARREAHAVRIADLQRLRADYAALQARLGAGEQPLSLAAAAPRELARILSHELRTPMIPLLALPDMLGESTSLPPGELNGYLRDVQQAGERLREIADDLIEFLAPPDLDMIAQRPISVERLMAWLQARFVGRAKKSGITLVLGEVAGLDIATDEARLLHALGRLLSNALAVTAPGGWIELTAREVGSDSVAFAIRDNGRGMTDAEIKIALAPFRQVDMSLTRRIGGMGLGLPLATRMAERLGGYLDIKSVPGEGTTAGIVLPHRQVVLPLS